MLIKSTFFDGLGMVRIIASSFDVYKTNNYLLSEKDKHKSFITVS